jgi:hypothetical protein
LSAIALGTLQVKICGISQDPDFAGALSIIKSIDGGKNWEIDLKEEKDLSCGNDDLFCSAEKDEAKKDPFCATGTGKVAKKVYIRTYRFKGNAVDFSAEAAKLMARMQAQQVAGGSSRGQKLADVAQMSILPIGVTEEGKAIDEIAEDIGRLYDLCEKRATDISLEVDRLPIRSKVGRIPIESGEGVFPIGSGVDLLSISLEEKQEYHAYADNVRRNGELRETDGLYFKHNFEYDWLSDNTSFFGSRYSIEAELRRGEELRRPKGIERRSLMRCYLQNAV